MRKAEVGGPHRLFLHQQTPPVQQLYVFDFTSSVLWKANGMIILQLSFNQERARAADLLTVSSRVN